MQGGGRPDRTRRMSSVAWGELDFGARVEDIGGASAMDARHARAEDASIVGTMTASLMEKLWCARAPASTDIVFEWASQG